MAAQGCSAHSELGLIDPENVQKTSLQPVCGGSSSNSGSIFPGDTGLCQVDRN